MNVAEMSLDGARLTVQCEGTMSEVAKDEMTGQILRLCDDALAGRDRAFARLIAASIDAGRVRPEDFDREFGAGSFAASFWARSRTRPKPAAQRHIVAWIRSQYDGSAPRIER